MTQYVDLIRPGEPGSSRTFNRRFTQLGNALYGWQTGVPQYSFSQLRLLAQATQTIDGSGAVTFNQSSLVVKANSGTVDDLDTISGGDNGDLVFIQPFPSDTITIRHGVGNLFLNRLADFTFAANTYLIMRRTTAGWVSVIQEGREVNRVGCKIRRSTAQTISNNTITSISFDTEVYDSGGYWTSGTDVTVPAGRYLIGVRGNWDTNGTGQRQMYPGTVVTGYYFVNAFPLGANPTPAAVFGIMAFSGSTTFQMRVLQVSGGNLDISNCELTIERMDV
jgi:hypothetical protein